MSLISRDFMERLLLHAPCESDLKYRRDVLAEKPIGAPRMAYGASHSRAMQGVSAKADSRTI